MVIVLICPECYNLFTGVQIWVFNSNQSLYNKNRINPGDILNYLIQLICIWQY